MYEAINPTLSYSVAEGIATGKEILPEANSFENGGTIIEHIISNLGWVFDVLIVLSEHVRIVWETIWF